MDKLLSLGIDLQSILFYLVNFGILFAFIAKYAYPQINGFLEKRQKSIQGNLDEANELKEADWLLAIISLLQPSSYTTEIIQALFIRLKNSQPNVIDQLLLLNSTPVDLTYELKQLM